MGKKTETERKTDEKDRKWETEGMKDIKRQGQAEKRRRDKQQRRDQQRHIKKRHWDEMGERQKTWQILTDREKTERAREKKAEVNKGRQNTRSTPACRLFVSALSGAAAGPPDVLWYETVDSGLWRGCSCDLIWTLWPGFRRDRRFSRVSRCTNQRLQGSTAAREDVSIKVIHWKTDLDRGAKSMWGYTSVANLQLSTGPSL